MEDNTDTFLFVQPQVIRGLEADGLDPDYVGGLRDKVAGVSQVLQAFHRQRRQLGDSGKYTRQGLEEAERELAAKASGEITRLLDTSLTHVSNNIKQVEQALKPQGKPDVMSELLSLWKQMEIRQVLLAQGVADDPLRAETVYRDALAQGDFLCAEALEGWPLGCPIRNESLLAQGCQAREVALNPLAGKQRAELVRLR
jgi:hypothetical protein